MRQVNRDELVWRLFSAMRHWSRGYLLGMFRHPGADCTLGAGRVVEELRYVGFYEGGPEPIGAKELRAVIATAIGGFPGGLRAMWLSNVADRRKEARATAANLLADTLERFDVLAEDDRSTRNQGDLGQILTFPAIVVAPHALRASWP